MLVQLFRIVIRCSMLLALVVAYGNAQAEPALQPFKVIYKGVDLHPEHPVVPYGGRLFFSQYDKARGDYDVVAFDIENQRSELIFHGQGGSRFVAQSDKYLVVSEDGKFPRPLVLIERATGARLKQIKLQRAISWATIEGDRLIVIQGGDSGYATNAPALVFELPSLRIVKSVELLGGNDAQQWEGKILSLGYDLTVYNNDLNEIFKITLPARKDGNGVSCSATAPLRVSGDKAVIVANCGEILIYDLRTRRLEHTIPSYAHFYSVAIVDGVIVTSGANEQNKLDGAHVYDGGFNEQVQKVKRDDA